MRRAREALDRLGVTDLARLDRAEQGKEFVQLHLRDADVVQEILREGHGVVRDCDEPDEHRVGINFEDTGHRTDAQAFGQRAHRPHEPLGRHALTM